MSYASYWGQRPMLPGSVQSRPSAISYQDWQGMNNLQRAEFTRNEGKVLGVPVQQANDPLKVLKDLFGEDIPEEARRLFLNSQTNREWTAASFARALRQKYPAMKIPNMPGDMGPVQTGFRNSSSMGMQRPGLF